MKQYLKNGSIFYYEGQGYRVKTVGGIETITGAAGHGYYANIDWWGEDMIQVTSHVFGKLIKSTLLFEDMTKSDFE